MIPLPIDDVRGELEGVWARGRNFVLTSPTGSGKSTRVPRFLLESGLVPEDQQIIVLQPRRLAARYLARRVSEELGEALGQTAGYQIRFERQASDRTRILFVTEGLLQKRLLTGRGMKGVGAILFDEFHERHLEGDLALALARQLQGGERPDLRLGVFSATLETGPVASYLGDCETVSSTGRQYPVDSEYVGGGERESLWDRAVKGVKRALRDGAEADILVFMPGRYEILKTLEGLSDLTETRGWDLLPLHGELNNAEQDCAVQPGERPKVIVATNIAETSITIPTVRTVVDSGVAKIPDFDPHRGINTLLTEKISRASADQRAGRAGRVAPGRCYRLWSRADHEHREAYTPAEVARLELSEAYLELSVSHQGDLAQFPWFEAPPAASWGAARQLLHDLGALKDDAPTEYAARMARFPMHPRYSRMLLAAEEHGCLSMAALAIALSEDRSILLPLRDRRKNEERDELLEPADGVSDWLRDIMAWQWAASKQFNGGFCREWGIHRHRALQARRVFQQIMKICEEQSLCEVEGCPPSPGGAGATADKSAFARRATADKLQRCLLIGFVDQLGKRRDRGTLVCDLVHNRRGEMRRDSRVQDARLFVSSEIEERDVRGDVSVLLGANTAVEADWLEDYFPDELTTFRGPVINEDTRRVEMVRRIVFRELVLEESRQTECDDPEAATILADAIIEHGWPIKKWNAEVERWIRRMNVLARHASELEISPIEAEDRKILLEQLCEGASSYKEVKDRDVFSVLTQWVPENILPLMDDWVPERFELSTGKRIKLRYEEDGTVVLPARIQELYDVPGSSLYICQGKVPLRIEILAPNQRPVQITDDLDGFWERQYPAIRKELFGRYPKHEWR